MDLIERAVVFGAGGLVGFVLGLICAHLRSIEEKLEIVDEHILHHELEDHPKDERGSWNLKWFTFNNVALFLVVVMVAYAAFSSQHVSNQVERKTESDRRALCRSGQDNRHVQRIMVEQIFQLATGSLVRNKEAPPLSESEVLAYNAYIDRVNTFRDSMYSQIAPTSICKSYVTDDDIRPPSPPFPYIKK